MTPAFFITPSICLSSSSRSVTTRMRASGSCSSSHLAISTIRMLLPLPWVCQMTPPSRLAMRSCAAFTPKNWCGRGTFLLAGVEDDEVADQVEQPGLVAHLGQRPVEQRAGGERRAGVRLVLPLHEELLRRAGGAVAQPLRIAAREHELHRAEEALVEDLLLVGDELAHAVGHLHRAALQLDHARWRCR